MSLLPVSVSPMQKQMLGYGLALFFMKGLSLIMLPITTRFLSPMQIGELELLAVSASFIGILLSASLHEALYRYCAKHKSLNRKRLIANQLFTLTLLISLSFSLLGLIVTASLEWQEHWPISQQSLLIVWLSLTIEGALAIALAWLRMQDKIEHFCRICMGTSLLQVTLVLLALQLDFGVIGVLWGGLLAHLMQLLLLISSGQLTLQRPQWAFIHTSLRYSLPLMLSGLIAFGLNGAERWFMLHGESLAMVGHYAIAAKFALAMCVLVQPFGMWWMPKRFVMAKQAPIKAAHTTEFGVVYVCALATAIAVIGQWLLTFTLTDTYAMAGQLLVGAIFMVLGKELAELVNLGLLHSHNTPIIFKVNLATTGSTLLCCSFTYQWGVGMIMLNIGAAQLIRALLLYCLSQRYHALPYRHIRMGLYPLVTLTGLISLQCLPNNVYIESGIVVLSVMTLALIFRYPKEYSAHFNKAGA
ncbi:lipopolysaccharide biosynthesis protein [Vibrio rarus]|uniref:lipopolysaccharide biosynthesis protein n=1 Tax=Vibrio rarus TaxID=413403 RepID=UPI0021C406E0|nr:oligosaccharide flippase family protein [Vibrio rarus]